MWFNRFKITFSHFHTHQVCNIQVNVSCVALQNPSVLNIFEHFSDFVFFFLAFPASQSFSLILLRWSETKWDAQAWHSDLSWGQHWRPRVHYLKWLFMVRQRLLASFPLPCFYLMGVQDTLARVHWCAFVICVSASNTQALISQILVPEIIEQRPEIIWKQRQEK